MSSWKRMPKQLRMWLRMRSSHCCSRAAADEADIWHNHSDYHWHSMMRTRLHQSHAHLLRHRKDSHENCTCWCKDSDSCCCCRHCHCSDSSPCSVDVNCSYCCHCSYSWNQCHCQHQLNVHVLHSRRTTNAGDLAAAPVCAILSGRT